jgi:hypothetical protein
MKCRLFAAENQKSNPKDNKSFPVSYIGIRPKSGAQAEDKLCCIPTSQLSDDRGEDILLRLPLDPHRELPGLVSPSDS